MISKEEFNKLEQQRMGRINKSQTDCNRKLMEETDKQIRTHWSSCYSGKLTFDITGFNHTDFEIQEALVQTNNLLKKMKIRVLFDKDNQRNTVGRRVFIISN